MRRVRVLRKRHNTVVPKKTTGMKKYFVIVTILGVFTTCDTYLELPRTDFGQSWKTKTIAPSPQSEGGDPIKGWEYLIYGDYIGSGIPYAVLGKRLGNKKKDAVLQRSGPNATLPFNLTAFSAKNGVLVTNGNCFACHASTFDGKVVIGLGNSFSDFRRNLKPLGKGLRLGMRLRYGKDSPEWAAYEDFGYYFTRMAPSIVTNQPGVNPAAHLAEACTAYRDPQTLTFTGTALYPLPDYTIATDVPPLWNVAKKNALYYTAVGRGDFSKLLFQASVLGIPDSAAARKAVTQFNDVVAWLRSLQAPKYPQSIDQQLAARGESLFSEHCSSCHGTYGREETYPNKVVALDLVKTDPYYAAYAVQAPIVKWYNESWFAQSSPASHFEPEAGYIAPPLDGIWATAPYLHNGAVPTLDDLLNSKGRPRYWSRSGDSKDYDYKKVGWNYRVANGPGGKWSYNTTLPGYSNAGHDFGDKLSDDERKAVIEYLKTL